MLFDDATRSIVRYTAARVMQTVPCNRRWQAAMQDVIQKAGTDKYAQELVRGLCALLLADRTKVPDVKEVVENGLWGYLQPTEISDVQFATQTALVTFGHTGDDDDAIFPTLRNNEHVTGIVYLLHPTQRNTPLLQPVNPAGINVHADRLSEACVNQNCKLFVLKC